MGPGLYTMAPRRPLSGALPGARVGLVINLGKTLEIEVGINLRGRDIGVPEQFLHRAQIAGRLQHMGGESVAQHVRMNVLAEAGLARRWFT